MWVSQRPSFIQMPARACSAGPSPLQMSPSSWSYLWTGQALGIVTAERLLLPCLAWFTNAGVDHLEGRFG